jgi:predicted dehydrogenase
LPSHISQWETLRFGRMAKTKMRVVVVGAGVAASFWMAPLRKRTEVVGLVEADDERVRAGRERFELDCPGFTSLDEALGATAPDVVVNATPVELHREIDEAALAAGCHVLTEKPLAPTFEDAVALVEAASRAGRTLAVMQNRRHHPAIRRLRQGVADGTIGATMALSADMWMAPRHPAGHPLERQRHPLLLDMAVHTFDQARFLSGLDAVRVDCRELTPPHSWHNGAAAAVATFEMEGGVVFSYRGNWISDGFRTSYDATWRVSGAEGTAVWDSFGAPACEVAIGPVPERGFRDVERTTWPVPEPPDATGHAAAIDDLLDALEAGRPSETDAARNLGTLAMVFAAIRSAEERRTVELAEIAGAAWPPGEPRAV